MYISGVDYESIADGVGVRAVIYVSGCSHKCFGCQNPQTHNANFGTKFTPKLAQEIIANIQNRAFLSGITLSGGDPLFESNITEVCAFIKSVKSAINRENFTIWLYTGYTWEELQKKRETNAHLNEILQNINVLVDGRFDINKADKSLAFRGSSNQKIIDTKKSELKNCVVLFEF